MAKKRPKFNTEMEIRGANRRLFARSPMVFEKLNESRQEFPRYKNDGTLAKRPWVKRQCEICNSWVSSTKIAIDHIDPVVPPEGFSTTLDVWERTIVFIKRLWCADLGIANLQRICNTCHDKKTYEERITRLLIKYNQELDDIQANWSTLIKEPKTLNKTLSKYIAKKKTIELLSVVQIAQALKDKLKSKRSEHV